MRMSWRQFIVSSRKVLWAAFLIALPVTSFPFIPAEFGGRTLVRPLSIYPLLLLVVILMLPALFKRRLPLTFLPLFAFIAVAIISTILSLSLEIEAYRGVTVFARVLRNLVTLALGTSVFLTVVFSNRSWDDLKFSLKWLYAGFVIALAWGSLQAVYVLDFNPSYYELLNLVNRLISTQDLNPTRISGLTYEPKWFAEQIVFLLLPWLLGSIFARQSIYRWRYKFITIEMLLTLWASGLLVLTFSRTGFAALILLTFLSFLLGWPMRRRRSAAGSKRKSPRWLRVAEALLAVSLMMVIFIAAGARNPYFSRFWRYWTADQPQNKSYLEYIAFSQRFTYTETALRIFEEFPVLGVGLGNYAFYFTEMLPDQPWNHSPEIIRQITPSERGPRLITPKNMFARLLAETGLIGTLTFLAFILALIGNVLFLWFAPPDNYRFWGLASALGMAAFLLLIFSTDSFAKPDMWVVFGFMTAAAHIQPAESEARQATAAPVEQQPVYPLEAPAGTHLNAA